VDRRGDSQGVCDHEVHLVPRDVVFPPARSFCDAVKASDQEDEISEQHGGEERPESSGESSQAGAGDAVGVEPGQDTEGEEREGLKANADAEDGVECD
jgi:hypothetical protein